MTPNVPVLYDKMYVDNPDQMSLAQVQAELAAGGGTPERRQMLWRKVDELTKGMPSTGMSDAWKQKLDDLADEIRRSRVLAAGALPAAQVTQATMMSKPVDWRVVRGRIPRMIPSYDDHQQPPPQQPRLAVCLRRA
jgi:hypothetical protein